MRRTSDVRPANPDATETPETPETPETGDHQEREPDYRFTLANERTFLAWLRTALSLLAAGVAVVQLVPAFGDPVVRTVTGSLLTVLAMVAAAAGVLRWSGVEHAIRRGRPLPRQRLPWVMTTGLIVLAVLVLGVVLLRGAS